MASHYDHGKWNKNSSFFFKIGLALSIILCIILFQTEIVSAPIDPPMKYAPEDSGTITPPPTQHKKKVVPPVKPPEPKDFIEDILDEPEFIESEPEIDPSDLMPSESTSETLLSFVNPE